MKCTNENCPCNLWSDDISNNCDHYNDATIKTCPSFKTEEKTKRLLTPMELFERGALFVGNDKLQADMIISFNENAIITHYKGYSVNYLYEHNYTWTCDRKTWNSFEIEEE